MYTKCLKVLLQLTIFGLFMAFITGCEGYSCAEGYVYDSNSKVPLDSVLCDAITGHKQTYSDSTGSYEVCNDFGGCAFGCKDITVRYSKKGYKSKDVSENFGQVYLDKE
jgi:hypothetical protein